MGTNKLVVLIVAALCLIVGVVIFNSLSDPKRGELAKAEQTDKVAKKPVQPVVADGDTVSETLKGIEARYEETLEQVDALEKKNAELERLVNKRARTGKGGQKNEPDPLVTEVKGRVSDLTSQVQALTNQLLVQQRKQKATENGYRVTDEDLGLAGGSDGAGQTVGTLPGYGRIVPMTTGNSSPLNELARFADKQLSGSKNNSPRTQTPLVNTLKDKGGLGEVEPFYTIPARSTLFEGVAMTALIGTVPVGGKVTDPFPAKFIVGENNLATNGLRIPGLKGIVFEGVARGNWNLSCVSVSITGGTFTFQDGRIQHLTFDRQSGQGGAKEYKAQSPYSEGEGTKSIGYITNPQGVPCIPGKRVTDAHRQLATMGLLGMSASYFDAKAAAEMTSRTNGLGDSTSVTGDKAKFISNSTYADATRTVMQFYEARMGDSFDAIYVNPAAPVVFNITQDLLIDYHSTARKLAYNTGGSHVNQLD